VPTSAITDLASTPGTTVKLLDHADIIPKLTEKYGPLYVKGVIPAGSYPGQKQDVQVADVWNVLAVHEDMDPKLVRDVVKTLFDRKADLVAVHAEAKNIELKNQTDDISPIPFHPAAKEYFAEASGKK